MLKVKTIPFFSNNFAYAFFRPGTKHFSLVDPAEYESVATYIAEDSELSTMKLTNILSTHKHWDHAGENNIWKERHPHINIYGGLIENVNSCTHHLNDGDTFTVEDDIEVETVLVPCHTSGHVLFYAGKKALFTGDCVFVGGVGKFFEGTATDMLKAVNKFKAFLDETEIYVGHEYTVSNFEWSSQVDSENKDIAARLKWARERVEAGQHTVPSTVGEEKRTNIFIRAAEMMKPLGVSTVEESMRLLREMKDNGVTSLTV